MSQPTTPEKRRTDECQNCYHPRDYHGWACTWGGCTCHLFEEPRLPTDPTPEPERQREPSPEGHLSGYWIPAGALSAAFEHGREQGRRDGQAHIDYLHNEHGYCAFPGCCD